MDYDDIPRDVIHMLGLHRPFPFLAVLFGLPYLAVWFLRLRHAKNLWTQALRYDTQGRVTEAEALLQRAVDALENLLGYMHPTLGTALEDHAALLRDIGRDADAEEADLRAERIGPAAPGHARRWNSRGLAEKENIGVDDIRAAAVGGDSVAQHQFGLRHLTGIGVTKNNAAALHWFRLAAEQGNTNARFGLAVMYQHGLAVPKDDVESLRWYTEAAQQGHAAAQYMLGLFFRWGVVKDQEESEAVAWWRKAADQGHPNAQFNLGVMYAEGCSLSQSYAEAAMWYLRAAEQGDANAQTNLGHAFRNGEGVPQDAGKALTWIERAAKQGAVNAQADVGMFYAEGLGVNRDFVRAYMWFSLAAIQGNGFARSNRAMAARMMTVTQRVEARLRFYLVLLPSLITQRLNSAASARIL